MITDVAQADIKKAVQTESDSVGKVRFLNIPAVKQSRQEPNVSTPKTVKSDQPRPIPNIPPRTVYGVRSRELSKQNPRRARDSE